jgi:curved DNA-binding protein CbpA
MAKRALIVLSQAEPARLLCDRLEALGFKAVVRGSAFEAVSELYGNQMSWILLGLDVFDRASRPQLLQPELWALNQNTPVVIVSGEDPVELRGFFAGGPVWLSGILEPPGAAEEWVVRALSLLETPDTTAIRRRAGRPAEPHPSGPRLAPPHRAQPVLVAEPEPADLKEPEVEPEPAAPQPRKPSPAARAARAAAAAAAVGGAAAQVRAAAVAPSGIGVLSVEERRRIETKIQLVDDGDLYRILEVPPAANDRQVKAAYFRLVKQFHPDRYFGRLDEEWGKHVTRLFRGITRAYETLLDPKSRERYDAAYRSVATIVVEQVATPVEEAEAEVEVEPVVEVERPPMRPAERVPFRPSPRAPERPAERAPERPAEPVRPPVIEEEEPLTREELEEFLRREREWMRERDSQAAVRAEALFAQAGEVLNHPDPGSLPLAPIRDAYKVLTEAVSLAPDEEEYVAAHERLREIYENKRAYYHYRRGQDRVAEGQLQLGYQDLKDAVLFDPKTEYLLALVQTMLQYRIDLARAEILTQSLVDEEPENAMYRVLYGRALAEQGFMRDGLAHLHLAVRLGMRSEAFRWIEHYERGTKSTQP